MPRLSPFLITALLLAASPARSHGGHGHIATEHAVTVTFTNEAGDALKGLSSRVIDPAGERILAGQTDNQGRVVFLPDSAGTWTVKAMSPEGHGGTVKVEINDHLRVVGNEEAHDHGHGERSAATPAPQGVTFAAAVGYLLGAFGVVALILSRKRTIG